MKKQYVLLGLLALMVQFAQAQFTLDGEFRPRSEYFGNGGNFTRGSNFRGENPNATGLPLFPATTATNDDEGFIRTTVRAAIKAKYITDSYTVFTSFQEVFAFGDRNQTATEGNGNFRVQEAWADLKLGANSSLKIGRQPLSYDDQRILGGLDWAQQARTHDAAIYKYSKDGYNLDIGGGLNTTTDEVFNQSALFSYRDMGFLHANKKYGNFNVSVLGLVNTFQDNKVLNADLIDNSDPDAPIAGKDDIRDTNTYGEDKSTLLTAGLHADYKLGDLSLTSNLFIQEGERVGGTDVKGAFLASLGATYSMDKTNSVGLTYEIISGRDTDTAAFFPLYGTNHAFNGLIDRFYVGNHANAGGLKDLQLTYKTKISGVALTIAGHYFTEQTDIAGNGDKDLGSEIDIILAKQFKEFKLVGGYSHFFEPSAVADLATTKDTQNWAWTMLIIKPNFLNGITK